MRQENAIKEGRITAKCDPAKTQRMRLMTIAEFCQYYRISPRTVWNWVRKGRLTAVRDAGGRVMRLVDPRWPILEEPGDPDPVMRLALLKPAQVAAVLGVLPSTVRKMATQGRIRSVWVGGQRRFTLCAVRRAIATKALGRRPRNSKEISDGMIRWAWSRLEQD